MHFAAAEPRRDSQPWSRVTRVSWRSWVDPHELAFQLHAVVDWTFVEGGASTRNSSDPASISRHLQISRNALKHRFPPVKSEKRTPSTGDETLPPTIHRTHVGSGGRAARHARSAAQAGDPQAIRSDPLSPRSRCSSRSRPWRCPRRKNFNRGSPRSRFPRTAKRDASGSRGSRGSGERSRSPDADRDS